MTARSNGMNPLGAGEREAGRCSWMTMRSNGASPALHTQIRLDTLGTRTRNPAGQKVIPELREARKIGTSSDADDEIILWLSAGLRVLRGTGTVPGHDPGGISAISRWLRSKATTPPDTSQLMIRPREGS